MSKFHSMIISFELGRNKELAEQEIKSLIAHDVAPSLALSILSQSPISLHTRKVERGWGQVPAVEPASTVGVALSNYIANLGGTIRILSVLPAGIEESATKPQLFTIGGQVGSQPGQWLEVLAKVIEERVINQTNGKLVIGLSSLVASIGQPKLIQLMRLLKQRAKLLQRSLRVVLPNKAAALNAASVKHNRLLVKGTELVLLPAAMVLPESGYQADQNICLAQTVAIFDPDRDAALDRGIPKSDPKAGMLPPKVARMMVNIAVGPIEQTGGNLTVVDPFCGHGRVLLEALLLGYAAVGRDQDANIVAAAEANVNWLRSQVEQGVWWSRVGRTVAKLPSSKLEVRDATVPMTMSVKSTQWVVVTEPWLGPPLRVKATLAEATRYGRQVTELVQAAWRVWASTANAPRRVIIALPQWQLASGQVHSIKEPVLDAMRASGYHAVCITALKRSDSLVAREIILATKN